RERPARGRREPARLARTRQAGEGVGRDPRPRLRHAGRCARHRRARARAPRRAARRGMGAPRLAGRRRARHRRHRAGAELAMTAPRATVTGSARLRPSRDARLVPYFLIAVGGLAASLIAGEPALAALAIPFALALGLGLRRIRPVTVTARFVLDTDQVLEDDPVTGRLELEWDGAFEAQVMLDRRRGVAPLSDHALSWSLPPASRSFQMPIRMRAAQWGRHTPGEVWLRMEAPLGLLTWTGKVIAAPALRVLPGSERLTR